MDLPSYSEIGLWLVLNLVAQIVGILLTRPLVTKLWNKYVRTEREPNLPTLVGAFDIFFYINALVFDFPEFSAIWLAFKLAGEWRLGDENNRSVFHIILIGNATNLIIGSLVGLTLIAAR